MGPEPLIFERSVPGRRGFGLGAPDGPTLPAREVLPAEQLRTRPPRLPEVSELDVVRHYTRLSQRNFCVDTHLYPLGSCTMKYNPKLHERVAALPGLARLHPLQPEHHVQGLLELLSELERSLCEVTGMDAFTLQPAAGAQGELAGLKIVAAHHRRMRRRRDVVLIPDSAHGTNPASAALAGFRVVQLQSGRDGLIDLEELRRKLDGSVAALMLTNPNTLGLFERNIRAVCELAHARDALVYMDGANMNALLGIAKPGEMGIDLLQLNLHKTFSTPHGGGGPGAGPVGVRAFLEPYLPVPRVRRRGRRFAWDARGRRSIGRLHGFHGNIGVLVRAHAYLLSLGREGVEGVGRTAIVNANYLKAKLAGASARPGGRDSAEGTGGGLAIPFPQHCMHEFVASVKDLKASGVTAWDVAKRLLDYGLYAPTVYFPLNVEEALMIEPPETESKETLDEFARALLAIIGEARAEPERLHDAPESLATWRLDEVRAARQPDLRWSAGEPGRSGQASAAAGRGGADDARAG